MRTVNKISSQSSLDDTRNLIFLGTRQIVGKSIHGGCAGRLQYVYCRCRSSDQWTHPISDQQLASKLGITVPTLQRHLKHLINLNLIDKQKGHDTGYYCYRLIAS
ncbi:MAG TPA: ArsR family transcriptional regulator [Planctomycetes bacterium]|nr:ArsR family transcriptional regulator [Planctomycetota bacterium]